MLVCVIRIYLHKCRKQKKSKRREFNPPHPPALPRFSSLECIVAAKFEMTSNYVLFSEIACKD